MDSKLRDDPQKRNTSFFSPGLWLFAHKNRFSRFYQRFIIYYVFGVFFRNVPRFLLFLKKLIKMKRGDVICFKGTSEVLNRFKNFKKAYYPESEYPNYIYIYILIFSQARHFSRSASKSCTGTQPRSSMFPSHLHPG